MFIGAISDDLTGGTDLALTLKRQGMAVTQFFGLPETADALGQPDAVVISLKSRTIPAKDAVAQSVAAAQALREAGARQIFFKYCSTFDSTDRGNIGPVAEALLAETGSPWAIVCPAFPATHRTIYQGHLFVGDQLLSDSPMRDHPLTPMRDANLARVLQRQTEVPVGRVTYSVVEQGPDVLRAALAAEAEAGRRLIVVDALSETHLLTIGTAQADIPLVTGGSGVAMGLPTNFGIAPTEGTAPERLSAAPGRALVLAGSCSEATRGQIAAFERAGLPALQLDPLAIAAGRQSLDDVMGWIDSQPDSAPALIYSSASPDAVAAAQKDLGLEEAGQMLENFLAGIATRAVEKDVSRLIVAGGETSGAVVGALGVKALAIGPEIAPGVPWTRVVSGPDIVLALKSGNFGQEDFFIRAWDLLE